MSDWVLHNYHFLSPGIQNIRCSQGLCHSLTFEQQHLPVFRCHQLLVKSAHCNEYSWALLSQRWNEGSTMICLLFVSFLVPSKVLPLENTASESLKFIYLCTHFWWPEFSYKSLILIPSEVMTSDQIMYCNNAFLQTRWCSITKVKLWVNFFQFSEFIRDGE